MESTWPTVELLQRPEKIEEEAGIGGAPAAARSRGAGGFGGGRVRVWLMRESERMTEDGKGGDRLGGRKEMLA